MRSEHIVLKTGERIQQKKERKQNRKRTGKKETDNTLFCENVKVHVWWVNMFNGLQVRVPAGG